MYNYENSNNDSDNNECFIIICFIKRTFYKDFKNYRNIEEIVKSYKRVKEVYKHRYTHTPHGPWEVKNVFYFIFTISVIYLNLKILSGIQDVTHNRFQMYQMHPE